MTYFRIPSEYLANRSAGYVAPLPTGLLIAHLELNLLGFLGDPYLITAIGQLEGGLMAFLLHLKIGWDKPRHLSFRWVQGVRYVER